MKGDLQQVQLLSDTYGIGVFEQPLNKYGWTALHAASYFGQIEIVKYLVEDLDINVNQTNVNGWHSLIFAVYGGQLEVIDFLLFEAGVDDQLEDKEQKTALTIA